MQTWQVILLGLIEGLTEFIPVSSTGHLLLIGHFLGFSSPGKTLEVLIQLGAILAILTVYAAKLLKLAASLPSSARARWFVLAVIVAFLPAAAIGAAAHRYIKAVLFETPWLICTTLVVGGDKDSVFSVAEQQSLRQQIPGASVEITEGIGHALHWEEPERFAAALSRVMKSAALVRR